MKPKEFKRWLEANGVKITQGGKHYRLEYNGKVSRLSRGSKDLDNEMAKTIKKQLGMV